MNGDAGSADVLCEPVNPKPGDPGPFSQFVVALLLLSGAGPAEKLKLLKGDDVDDVDEVDGESAAPNSSGSWNFAEPSAFVPPIDVVSKASAPFAAKSADSNTAAVMAR
ncbi:MAG TPA: hypothetical protein PKE16_15930 [Hyphomicrobium sp.]|nr:hypothetical protein [Hyphomicrobium sp.]